MFYANHFLFTRATPKDPEEAANGGCGPSPFLPASNHKTSVMMRWATGKISALKKDAIADVPGICAPARVSVALFSARPLLFRADGQSPTWRAPVSGRPIPSFDLRFYSLIHEISINS
jgi:hypothetical protein